MTPREMFEKVAAHLLAQGQKSLLRPNSTLCAYRGVGGLSCAVGCLITDEAYASSEAMEGRGALYGTVLEALRQSGVDADDELTRELLHSLQQIHDNCDPAAWAGQLGVLREKYFPEAT